MHVLVDGLANRTSGLAHAGPVIFALSVDMCALGRLLGMSYNSRRGTV